MFFYSPRAAQIRWEGETSRGHTTNISAPRASLHSLLEHPPISSSGIPPFSPRVPPQHHPRPLPSPPGKDRRAHSHPDASIKKREILVFSCFITDLRQRGHHPAGTLQSWCGPRTGHAPTPARGTEEVQHPQRSGAEILHPHSTALSSRSCIWGAESFFLCPGGFSVLGAAGGFSPMSCAISHPPLQSLRQPQSRQHPPLSCPSCPSSFPVSKRWTGGRETPAPSHPRLVARPAALSLPGSWRGCGSTAAARARIASPCWCRSLRAPTAGTRRWGAPRGCCASI